MSPAAIALVLAGMLTGCHLVNFKGQDKASDAAATTQPAWHIMPVSMRIYPSSRILTQDGQTILEARVELFDQAGDTTKGVGTMGFELYPATPGGEPASAKRIEAWESPILTLAQNRAHWDSITRTYEFRLHVAASPPSSPLLTVTFTPATGKRLTAQRTLGF